MTNTSQLCGHAPVLFLCAFRAHPLIGPGTWPVTKHNPGGAHGLWLVFVTDAALQKTPLWPAWHLAYLLCIRPYVSVLLCLAL